MTIMTRVVRMDTKRRPTLPSELLDAAGISIGEDLVASTSGDGAVVLRSRSASLHLIRDEISEGFGHASPVQDVPSLREDRDADDAALDQRIAAVSDNTEAAGAALLARLAL